MFHHELEKSPFNIVHECNETVQHLVHYFSILFPFEKYHPYWKTSYYVGGRTEQQWNKMSSL